VCATQGDDIPKLFRVIAILSRFYTPKTTKNQFDPLKFGDYRLWMAASDVLFSPLLICSNQHLLIPCVK
jgi:hypothetical protein